MIGIRGITAAPMVKSKTGEWIAGKIAECVPGGVRGQPGMVDAAISDLLVAFAFLEGKRSQLFGMTAQVNAIPEAMELRASCMTAIQGWFRELSKSDPASQVVLYQKLRQMKLNLGVSEPEILTKARTLISERNQALEQLGRPSMALAAWPELQKAVLDLRSLATIPLKSAQKYLRLPRDLSVASFDWLADTWLDVASSGLDPECLPLAGADGDYLVLYVSSELLAGRDSPLLYYFHEEDPPLTFVFDSCQTAATVLRAASSKTPKKETSCGRLTQGVERLLSVRRGKPRGELERDADRYEGAGNHFAATHIRAGAVWKTYESKLRGIWTELGVAHPPLIPQDFE